MRLTGRRSGSFVLAAVLLAGAPAGCWSMESADREATGIRIEKQAEVGARPIVRPEDPTPPRAPAPSPTPVPAVMSLADAVRIATEHNRDYQTRREAVHLASLDLGLTRRDFSLPVFSGSVAYFFTDSRRGEPVRTADARVAATQVLPTGARLEVSGTAADTETERPGPDGSATVGATARLTQPLLRGRAPYAFEPLTQAERSLLYGMRDFELFRQDFAIDVVSRYYGLAAQKQRVANARRSTEALEFIARRANAFFNVDRLNKIEKLRADQAYLSSKNGLIDEEQGFQLARDRFKVFLGLPTDVDFDVPADAAPAFVPVTMDLETAVRLAIANRLDLATARDRLVDAERRVAIAENGMLPDLSLSGSYGIGSDPQSRVERLAFRDDEYSVGVELALPLDRKPERNALRAARTAADRARRAVQLAEDNLILEVRDTLRRLRQQEQSIAIQREIIETETARVRYAELQYQAGEIGTRDLTEARQNLLDAENSLIRNVVEYELSRLGLLRQLGLLGVTEGGEIVGR